MNGRCHQVLLAAVAASAISTGAHAGDIRPVMRMSAEFGGDTLVDVSFTDGTQDRLESNRLLALGGGASWINDAGNLEVEVTLAYKFTTVEGTNGSVEFVRYPLDALVFYRAQQFRVGAGVTYHLKPQVKGTGVAEDIQGKFDNALGAIVQADWLFTEHVSVGVRYTFLDYKLKGPESFTPNSDGFGVTFGYRF